MTPKKEQGLPYVEYEPKTPPVQSENSDVLHTPLKSLSNKIENHSSDMLTKSLPTRFDVMWGHQSTASYDVFINFFHILV